LILVALDTDTAWEILNNRCMVGGDHVPALTYNHSFLELVMARRGYVFAHISRRCWLSLSQRVRSAFLGSKAMIVTTEVLESSLNPADPAYPCVASRFRSGLLLLQSLGSRDLKRFVLSAMRDARLTASIIALVSLGLTTSGIIGIRQLLEEALSFGYKVDWVRRPMGEANKFARIMQNWAEDNPHGLALRRLAEDYKSAIRDLQDALKDSPGKAHADQAVLHSKALMTQLSVQSMNIHNDGYSVAFDDRAAATQSLQRIRRSMAVRIAKGEFWNAVAGSSLEAARSYVTMKRRG
jgi:hypothetical protein